MAKPKIKRDRRVFAGYDAQKMAKIWKVLTDAGDWIHIAEIARRSSVNAVTVRWYLDHYFKQVIDEQKLAPTVKFRAVRLRQGADFAGLLRAHEFIRSVKKERQ